MIEAAQVSSDAVSRSPLTGAPLAVHSLGLGTARIDYTDGWRLQRELHAEVVRGDRPDTLLLLEHNEVFTAGSRTQPSDLPTDGSEVIDVDRGGRITWHGPGQLVGYPIVRLPQRLDVVAYVRSLEALLIGVCSSFDVPGRRIEGRSGVWVQPEPDLVAAKVAAIGVRVASGVTMHGFSLNCDCALDWSRRIVPCGLTDAAVTSLSREAGRRISVTTAADTLRSSLAPPAGTDGAI